MRLTKKFIILAAFIAVLLFGPCPLYAQRRVIDEANIEEQEGCAVIVVQFDFPVRYMRHFPSGPSEEVRIQFEPISMGSSSGENLFEREDVRVSLDGSVPLEEVTFEGNITGGPFLTLTFGRTISFKVEQGTDFRSLVVIPYQDDERTECFPAD